MVQKESSGSKWLNLINKRLTEDGVITTEVKCDKGFSDLVINTWDKVLKKRGDILNKLLHSGDIAVRF